MAIKPHRLFFLSILSSIINEERISKYYTIFGVAIFNNKKPTNHYASKKKVER